MGNKRLRKTNVLSYLMILLLLVSSLSGCTSGKDSGQGTEETTQTEEQADSNAAVDSHQDSDETSVSEESEHEPITIMDAQRDYSGLIELVHEKYPEINIEVIPYRGRNMSAYTKHQLENGRMPDIYSTTQAWDGEYQKEYLVDLSNYEVATLYSPARLSEYMVDGSLYLLPFDYTVSGIVYNKSLFERLNIEAPSSFQQLRDETIPALQANGVKVASSLLDLPGSAFNYFFNISSGMYMNTIDGRQWRSSFSDVESDTFASDNEELAACAEYFQEWIDCGMLVRDEASESYTGVIEDFEAGNTAFIVGTVNRFSQYEDGTGDQYGILPYFSMDGDQNCYITTSGRLYGLNKELEQEGNEQKLEDALHVLEVLSSNEGYTAIYGENGTNMCSIADFVVAEDSPFEEAMEQVSKGYAMNQVYTGWDAYLVPFGEAVRDWIAGTGDAQTAFQMLDDTKRSVQEAGVTSYATVTEELDTVQAAQLSGQMFMEATGADAALISYNVYSPEVNAMMENSYGANGTVLTGPLTEEYITIFLPTGWYDTLQTVELSGSELMKLAEEGADTRGTGFKYPYVLLTADGEEVDENGTYLVVVCGNNKSEDEALELTDTGIVGLDAAKDYLLKVKEVSSETLDESLVQYVGTVDAE